MHNILIVEDNDDLRIQIKEILVSTFPSVHVVDAGDADEALRLFWGNTYDIIVMDLRLPEKSGLWLIERLKPMSRETVFIVNSNYDSPEYRNAAFKRGADFFLSKRENSINDITALIQSIFSGRAVKDWQHIHGFDG